MVVDVTNPTDIFQTTGANHMPIYEYECQDCGRTFEFLVIAGGEPDACDTCSSHKICRMMSACSFYSKGDGGQTVKSTAAASSCGGCSASSCAGCGH
jgi:putative FmdB family regulatory protein